MNDMFKRKIYLIWGLILFLLTLIFTFPNYVGDGDLVNNRWFMIVGYHYEIGLDKIEFKDETVSKIYNFYGVPFQTYKLHLNIVSPGDLKHKNSFENQPFYDDLYDSGIKVKVLLMEDGTRIYALGGNLSSDHWALADWRFYLSSSEHQFSRYSSYTLQISIKSQKPLKDKVIFQPYLLGGDYRVF